MATPMSTNSSAGSDDSGRDQPPNKRKLNNETSCVDDEVGEEAKDQQPQSKKARKQTTTTKEQTTSMADTAVTSRAANTDRESKSSNEQSSGSNRPAALPAVADATVAAARARTQGETERSNSLLVRAAAATAVTEPAASVAGANTQSSPLPPPTPQLASAATAAAAAVSLSSAGSDRRVTAAQSCRIIEGMRQDRDREAEALIWTGLPLAIDRIQIYLLGGAFNAATFTQLQQQDERKHQQERQKMQEIAIRELQRALAHKENSSSPIADDDDDDGQDDSEADELEDEEEEEEEVESETESDVNNKGDDEIVDDALSSESAVYNLTTNIQNSVKRLLQGLSEHSTRLREWVRLHVPQSMYGYNIGQAARDQAIAIVDEAEQFATFWLAEINSYQLRRAELQRSANKLSNVIDERRLVNEFDEYQFGVLQRTVVKARSMYSGLYHSFTVNYDQLQSFHANARPPIGFS